VSIPLAVADELNEGIRLGYECPQIATCSGLSVQELPGGQFIPNVPDLGTGEAQVIAMALMHAGSLAIIDDALGRQIAKLNGIAVTGTGGVLLRAREQDLIESMTETLDHLTAAGFWLDDGTRRLLIEHAGE